MKIEEMVRTIRLVASNCTLPNVQRDSLLEVAEELSKLEKKATEKAVRANKESNARYPTVEEVKAYCEEKGYTDINPQAFIDYYEQSGWTMGNGKKVVSWKACVRTWHNNEEKRVQKEKENREYWENQRRNKTKNRFSALDEAIMRAGG